MKKTDVAFLKSLCEAPSPSGFEQPAAKLFAARAKLTATKVATNVMGSVHATLAGKNQDGKSQGPSVLIAGHIDEVGLMVNYISDEGYIYATAIGGVDAAILPGQRVDVWPSNAKTPVRGVVGRKPIHLIETEERKTVTALDKLFIDTGLSGKELKQKVSVGDHITYGVGFEEIGSGFAVSKAFDDKLGAYIAIRVLEEVKAAGGAAGDVIAAGTVQEEIGLRGGITSAYGINPDIGICAEVGHATDYPGVDKTKHGEAICGKGPLIAKGPNINPAIYKKLVAAAKKAKIKYQIDPSPGGTGTDANAMQLARGGKPVGLISVPIRYMHTPTETLKLSDIEDAVKLLTRFILDLSPKDSFIP